MERRSCHLHGLLPILWKAALFCAPLLPPGTDAAGVRYTIAVDAAATQGPWNRFYEEAVGTCHTYTVINSWRKGRNIQPALRRGLNECGFKRFRAHGTLDDDIGVYQEDASGNVTYNWTRFDSCFDAAYAIGMKAVVEFSFLPRKLASGSSTAFWYNNAPGYSSPPKDYNKWRDLCKEVVVHLEQKYGAEEIRKNWYFEVWNEPDWFFSGTQTDYLRMYDYASEGVGLADPLVRVGGPTTSAANGMSWIGPFVDHVRTGANYATGQTGSKCDFVTYHCYSDDGLAGGVLSSPGAMNAYHKMIVDGVRAKGFTGEIINTEWAPSFKFNPQHSSDESSASFIAKTIHLLASNGPNYPPPAVYSFWMLSEIFEEVERGDAQMGWWQFGMLLMGNDNIPVSQDIAKTSFNAFKLLHKMTDTRVSLTGGTMSDGVNGCATVSKDGRSLQVLLYSHIDGAAGDLSTGVVDSDRADSITLTVSNIPFAPGSVRVERWLVDRDHSNSYRAWQKMGEPAYPTQAQWEQMKAAGELQYASAPETVTLPATQFATKFPLKQFSVALINLSNPAVVPVRSEEKSDAPARSMSLRANGDLVIDLPAAGVRSVVVYDMRGRRVVSTQGARICAPHLSRGAYVAAVECRNGIQRLPLVVR